MLLLVSRAVCVAVALVPCLVWAQIIGSPDNSAVVDTCHCTPGCEGEVSPGDCRGRLVPRPDCPCCRVCARQEGAPCVNPTQPCDSEFGLVCSPEGVCKAEYSCSSDAECPDDRFCLGDVCVDPCPILTPCQGSLRGGTCMVREHRPLCECPPGTLANPEISLCIPVNGTEDDDDNSTHQVQPATEPSKVEGKAGVGALKVRQVNHNSSTIILPATKGGELYYKSLESTEWLQEHVSAGQDSVVLRGLVPKTQYTLKWSGNFGGSAKVTIDTVDGCRTANQHSYGVSEEWSEGCQQRCSCRPEGRVDCQPRCLFVAGDIHDPQCIERPSQEDPECCVAYDCSSGHGEGEVSAPHAQDVTGLPKLLVTAKTHNSVTLAWDDFRARTYEGGYVAEYREEGIGGSSSQEPWKRKEVPPGEQPPKITVEALKPNTLYEVRVSIYDDVEAGRLGESTETINFRTDAGCEHGNSSHAVGEFFNGCEERCMCLPTGMVRCFERCTLPYIRTGSFKGDPFCSEKQSETDECCAIVQCTSSKREYTPCTNVVCGPNAECISSAPATGELSLAVLESDLTPGYCRCNDGFMGDASDLVTGCIPDPSAGQREGNCTFKNSTYRPGDVFYDKCDYRCSCNNNTEIECEPRCEFPHKDGSEPEPGCEYLPDPHDECCKLRVCNSTSAAATDAARAPSLPSDGCTRGNVTYARNEKFYNGCETQCICMGFGDVSCFPRCPPLKVMSESPKRCETLPDPLDPCCSITVCDEETPDVMKANITELEDELMKNMTDEEKELIKKQMMNLTDTEKAVMIREIMNISEAQKDSMINITLTEKPNNTTMMMEHTHEDGTIHSHPHDDEHTHTHKEGTTHNHPHNGPHMHNETDMFTHTHEDGTTHSHPHDGFHTHNGTDPFLHTHADGTTHSHPHDGPHTHDEHTHTHKDGTTHSHPHDGPHTHNDTDMFTHTHEDGTTHTLPHDDEHTHTHEDGTTHSHPHEGAHTHDDEHTHTHEDGTTHSHTHDGPHTHNETNEFLHTHEDGTTHSHPRDGFHTHNGSDPFLHTHADGTTHSHPHDGPHTHDDDGKINVTDIHLHTHADGTTHSHLHDVPHTHDDDDKINVTDIHLHTHADGTTHSHTHDGPHTHNETNEFLHIHEDGTTHSHPHDGSHAHDDEHTHTHEDGTTHSHLHDGPHTHDEHTHTHEDGTTHSHLHDGPHTHNDTDMLTHTHEDGTTHTHPHDGFHTHNGTDPFLHTHADGTTHSHPHDGPHTHDEDMVNETDIHFHVHEDGTAHSHPHDEESHTHTHKDGTTHSHPHDHDMNNLHDHEHTHDDGTTHSHAHDHNMPDSHDHEHDHIHEHTHDDGTTHSHSHDHTFTNDHDHDHNMTDNHENGMEDSHNVTDEMHHERGMQFEKKNRAEDLGTHDLHILEVSPLNTTTVMITIAVSDAVMQQILSSEEQYFTVLYSPDSLTWSERKIPVSDIKVESFKKIVLYLNDLQPSTPYQFRVAFQEFVSSTSKARLMDGTIDRDGREPVDIDTSSMCFNNGSYYKQGEEFYEGCSNSCICTESLEVHCVAIECPVTFGLELIDPNCFEWDVDPDYVPTPPKCCPQVKCVKTYACEYMGQTFNNYDEVPRELTGCSQVCTCNFGNVSCRPLCEEVPPIPPPHLNCAPETAVLITLPGETCCRSWQCPSHSVGTDEIPEPHIASLDAGTLHLVFSTPSLYEGLPGKLVIRYTNESSLHPDPSSWHEEVVLPEGSLITQTQWDHILTGLMPATDYSMQIALTIHGAEPKHSPIFNYTTMPEATTPLTTTPLPRLDIDAELYASAITKTSAKVSWRGFNEYELQYIDGVQVKYTEKDKLIPRFSQLFHRDNNQMDVRDLQPGHTYTVDLVFISHPNQTTQVSNTKPITFSTLPEEDLYAFEIQVQAGKVSSQTAELFYSGVPEPEEKFVNVYRVVYLREDERVDAQAFKIPKTGQDRKIFLEDLKPDVEYKVWIEAFLSNGRKKQSNVITITTRAGQLPKPERSEVDPSARDTEGGEDYYPAMVAVAIIAAIACAAFLALLVILLRRNKSQRKANINSGNNAAYDNPSYKVGDNTYDMEMNGIKSSGNGATYAEDP